MPPDFFDAARNSAEFQKAMSEELEKVIPQDIHAKLSPEQWKILVGDFIRLNFNIGLLEEQIKTDIIQIAQKLTYPTQEK